MKWLPASWLSFVDLRPERESPEVILQQVEQAVPFRGTNLWILIFAIFVASLGLNVNSTAVIIGAMLISPLMGPIMGIGFSVATRDTFLLRRALSNYLFATLVALTTSTLFFLITPLQEAHSEILARTEPTVYDVLIALVGGFAGTLALSSNKKGNVIPGVAIATALMPPLCTAGYGLATGHWTYFGGAFYLFFINTVFIALATGLSIRLFDLHPAQPVRPQIGRIAAFFTWGVVILTVLPSIYFGWVTVQQARFQAQAKRFIRIELPSLKRTILRTELDVQEKRIQVSVLGQRLADTTQQRLRDRLRQYGLSTTNLVFEAGLGHLGLDELKEKQAITWSTLQALVEQQQAMLDSIRQLNEQQQVLRLASDLPIRLTQAFPELDSVRVLVRPQQLLQSNAVPAYLPLIVQCFKLKWKAEERKLLQRWVDQQGFAVGVELVCQ